MTKPALSIICALLIGSIALVLPQAQAQLTDARLLAIGRELDREFGGFDDLLSAMVHQERVALRTEAAGASAPDPRPRMRILTARGNVFSPRALAKHFADKIGAEFVYVSLTQFGEIHAQLEDPAARQNFVQSVESYFKQVLLTPLLEDGADDPARKFFFYIDGIDQIPPSAAQFLHSILRSGKLQVFLNPENPDAPGAQPVQHTVDFSRFHFLVTATSTAGDIDAAFGLSRTFGLRQNQDPTAVNRMLVVNRLDRNGYPHASQQLYQSVVIAAPPSQAEFVRLIEVFSKRLILEVSSQLGVRVARILGLKEFSSQVAEEFYGPELFFESLARDMKTHLERVVLSTPGGTSPKSLRLDPERFIRFVRTGACEARLTF